MATRVMVLWYYCGIVGMWSSPGSEASIGICGSTGNTGIREVCGVVLVATREFDIVVVLVFVVRKVAIGDMCAGLGKGVTQEYRPLSSATFQ